MTEDKKPLVVLFDATRLLARGTHSTPTGIDRVDLAYVEALRRDPAFDLRLITFDALGPRLLPARQAEPLLERLLQRWRQPQAADPDGRGSIVRDWLCSAPLTPRPPPANAAAPNRLQRLRQTLRPSLSTLRASRLRPADAQLHGVYLNTSHGQLYRPAVARWLARSGIPAVFFVHDLIPIEYPEYNRPREFARHAARLRIISRHARQVLVNSQATANALQSYLHTQQLAVPPIAALPLGVEMPPPQNGAGAVEAALPYFVMLGTLEPRKNHLLMLQCWRRLIEEDGARAPRLLLIGRRGWENQSVFQLLDRAPVLSRHVIECSDLHDTEVAELIRGARALLMPSHAEGYGLPVVEALSLGTPVLASDIAAHREVGGDFAEYLDPLDGAGWIKAIRDCAAGNSARRERMRQALGEFCAPDWRAHFAIALPLIRAADAQAKVTSSD